MARRLQKGKNRLLLGVAGGLAEYSNIDPVIIRAAFILLAFAGGTGIVLYLLLALLIAGLIWNRPGPAQQKTAARLFRA